MNYRTYRNATIIAIFAVSLIAPLAATVFKLDRSPALQENREHAKFPVVSFEKAALKRFPHDFYNYFKDNFGFRDVFIRLNFLIRRRLLRETEFNEVLFGENGWLFFLGEHEMDDARGITHYSDDTLAMWTASLERKRQWLAARGIRYLFVIAPNKETIYGENLPSYYRSVAITGLDEFVDYVGTHSRVEMLDLRPALLAAKKNERLYKKTDTHWNRYGAFLAYQEIVKAMSRGVSSKPASALSDFTIEKRYEKGGDLALLVGGSEFITEEEINLIPHKKRLACRVEMNTGDPRTYAMRQENKKLPKAIVFRDSFFDEIIPYISEHFQHVQYYRKHWDQSVPIASIVAEVRPDIVIEEFAERRIKMDMGSFSPPD
ncbi:hypothetical protein [Geobacter sp. AOG2]|uniref:alginate O-acetyltransferase AlgX-related protein n=1 Tax=Geobacter sp. AOG2 TaxID=1566347 RepID=UPI001CC65078|nr:hypothetical protein [Geobacter sp. AOG2]GFE62009.1 hypothetical protein AOG2_25970 [Geobacter sp. AOG2]